MMRSNKGFTLVEILVVVALSALFASFAISFSKIGQNQLNLSVEGAKVSQFILQAKELTIATFNGAANACGYGVHIDYVNQTYSLFKYVPSGAPPCPSAASTTDAGISLSDMQEYASSSWQVPLSTGVVMKSTAPTNDVLTDVLFYPPDPFILISTDGATFPNPPATARIYMMSSDGGDAITVSVNPAGQVSL
jgi:prepilin-type N-terminal cleavage/methylation domain-containing protein